MTGRRSWRPESTRRVGGGLEFGLLADVAVSARVSIGAAVSALWLLGAQSYAFENTSVFQPPPFGAVAGIRLSAALD